MMSAGSSDQESTHGASDDPDQDSALGPAVARLGSTADVSFTVRIGGGYDRAEVDSFLANLSRSVDEVRAALAMEREELAELRAEAARSRARTDSDLDEQIALGAVDLLSRAQLIADKAIADAEQYARDLVVAARNQYRELLDSAGPAGDRPSAPSSMSGGASIPEIEYVRTYTHVARIQLRSVLDALAEQVDLLGDLPSPDGTPSPQDTDDGDVPDEPDWVPTPSIQRTTYVKPGEAPSRSGRKRTA